MVTVVWDRPPRATRPLCHSLIPSLIRLRSAVLSEHHPRQSALVMDLADLRWTRMCRLGKKACWAKPRGQLVTRDSWRQLGCPRIPLLRCQVTISSSNNYVASAKQASDGKGAAGRCSNRIACGRLHTTGIPALTCIDDLERPICR